MNSNKAVFLLAGLVLICFAFGAFAQPAVDPLLAKLNALPTDERQVAPWRAGSELQWRSKIIPSPPEPATEPSCDDAHAQGAPARISWARLVKRVFDTDIEQCPNCGDALKIIAAIEDPPVIIKILTHLGLPTRAPPRAPAQRFDLFQTT